jgi:hypothetical protein
MLETVAKESDSLNVKRKSFIIRFGNKGKIKNELMEIKSIHKNIVDLGGYSFFIDESTGTTFQI